MRNRLIYTFLLPLLVVLGLGAMQLLPPLEVCGYKMRRVNLLSDVVVKSDEALPDTAVQKEEPLVLDTIPVVLKKKYTEVHPAGLTPIEDFSDREPSDRNDTAFVGRGMEHFYEMLMHVRQLGRPVRIAYFGDSFIEGDILTDELRALLQTRFGGCGVGFVDMASPIAGFRQSVRASSKGWESHCITDTQGRFNRARQGIAERYFIPKRMASTSLNGIPKRWKKHQDTCQISQIFFRAPEGITLRVRINEEEAQTFQSLASDEVQALGVRGRIGKVTWSVEGDSLSPSTFFGATLDGEEGIILDNFSLRGSSGLTLRTIPDATLEEFAQVRPYDLIVLHFGLNVAKRNRLNYDGYEQQMQKVVRKLAHAFPKASILIVSVSDRGERSEDDTQVTTMRGIERLVKFQQQLALHTGTGYWNLFQAMGAQGSMAQMADTVPALANKDYTHLNFAGGRFLARLMYEALLDGLENYEKRKRYEAEP